MTVTLVAAVVCLVVMMLVAAALVRSLVIQQRQSRDVVQKLQAMWLAESAVGRAAVRLREDAAYPGETWRVDIAVGNKTLSAAVLIRVDPVEGRADQRNVHIESRWPDDPLDRSMHRKDVVIQLSSLGERT